MRRGRSRRHFLAGATALLLGLPGSACALTWQTEIAARRDAIWTSLALDSQQRPHISAFDVGNQALTYTRFDGTTWRSEVVDGGIPNAAGSGSALALDAQDRPHISYGYQQFDPVSNQLRYARFDGTAWRIEVLEATSPGGGLFGYTSIALDAQGRPHISYCDCFNLRLKYAHFDGTAWHVETVDGRTPGFTSLKVDAQGHPHISYSGGLQALRYAHFDGTAWRIETVDTQGGGHTSIALDGGGWPRIAYQAFGGLKYARWDGTTWRIEVADPAGGLYVSLGLTGAGYPVISYYTPWIKGGAVQLARFDGLTWQIATVDSGDVGAWGSLQVDAQDRVHISYNAEFFAALKYARGTPEVRLDLQLNQPSFRPGDTLMLAATVTPGPVPPTADAYVAVAVPGGPLLFLQGDGGFTRDVRPLVSDWPVVPFAGELFRYPFAGSEPPGTYTWLAAFTRPGTLTLIEPLVTVSFSFAP